MKAAAAPSTRARELLQRDGDAPAAKVTRLSAQLAEALAQLEREREFIKSSCYTVNEEAALRCRLVEAMREQWPALTAALEAGGEAFDRIMYRIECRIYGG